MCLGGGGLGSDSLGQDLQVPLKSSFLLANLIFEVGSLICGAALSSSVLIVGRAIAGMCAAGQTSGAYTILSFATEPKKRPMYTGILGSSYGIASVIGPFTGGAFADRVTWRWCFWLNLPIGTAAAKPMPASISERFIQIDPIRVILTMGGVVSFILAVQYGGQTYDWNSTVIGLLVGFVQISLALASWEYFNAVELWFHCASSGNERTWFTASTGFCSAGLGILLSTTFRYTFRALTT